MPEHDHTEDNISKLVSRTQPELTLGEEARQKALLALQEAASGKTFGSPRQRRKLMVSMKWLGYAAAVCFGVIITLAGLSLTGSFDRHETAQPVNSNGSPAVEPAPLAAPAGAPARPVAEDLPAATGTTARPSETGGASDADLKRLLEAGDVRGLTAALADGPFESRLIAANYLAVLGDANAIPAIEEASRAFNGPQWANPFAPSLDVLKELKDRPAGGISRLRYGPLADMPRLVIVTVCDSATKEPIADANVVVVEKDNAGKDGAVHKGQTDAAGVYRVAVSSTTQNAKVTAACRGYVSGTQSQWVQTGRQTPATTTLSLPKAIVVGGIVKGEEGEPLAGVSVTLTPTGRFGSPRFVSQPSPVITDEDGLWTDDKSIPEGAMGIRFECTHPDHVQKVSPYANLHGGEFGLLKMGQYPMTMVKGISLAGVVKDPDGQPVAGATVSIADAEYPSSQPLHTVTDSSGCFRLPLCKPGQISLQAVADGYIGNKISMAAERDTNDIEISLITGQTLLGKVTDAYGRPIPDVQICQVGQPLDVSEMKWRTTTDISGRFRWDMAPPKDGVLLFSKDGFMKGWRTVTPGDEEQTFVLSEPVTVSGKVSDSVTGQPVGQFNASVATGIGPQGMAFKSDGFSDGSYSLTIEHEGEQYRLRVAAPGYLDPDSIVLPQAENGHITCDVTLTPESAKTTRSVSGVVHRPDGSPASGTKLVASHAESMTRFTDGEFVTSHGDAAPQAMADAQGRFSLSGVPEAFELIATHDSGFGHIDEGGLAAGQPVRLEPWGSIKGNLTIDSKPANEVAITLRRTSSARVLPNSGGYIGWSWEQTTKTDALGNFGFDRAPAGRYHVAPLAPEGLQNRLAHLGRSITISAGETTEVSLGNKGGRSVTAVLQRPEGLPEDVLWSHAMTRLDSAGNFECVLAADEASRRVPYTWPTDLAQMGFSEVLAWHQQWSASPEGQAYKQELGRVRKLLLAGRQNIQHRASLSANGRLTAVDVAPGEYIVKVLFIQRSNDIRFVGVGSCPVTVPPAGSGEEDQAVDLGTLHLDMLLIAPGNPMPPLTLLSADGKELALASFGGKYVLATRWPSMVNNLDTENTRRHIDQLTAATKRFVSDQRISIINLTSQIRQPELTLFLKFLIQNNLTNALLIPTDRENMRTIEAMNTMRSILIGPDGRIVLVHDAAVQSDITLEDEIAAALEAGGSGSMPAVTER